MRPSSRPGFSLSSGDSQALPTVGIWSPILRTGNISSDNIAPGAVIPLSVNVTNAPTFDYYSFNLEYHPGILGFVDSTLEGTVFWPDFVTQFVVDDQAGTTYVVVKGSRTASGNGVLVFVRFRVLQTSLSLLSVVQSVLQLGTASINHKSSGGCFNNRTPRSPNVDFNMNPAPDYFETSEFMIGKIAVGVVLPESTGPKYNWTDGEVIQTISGIKQAMSWWESQEPNAKTSFVYDEQIRVPTDYEPIEMRSWESDIWIRDVMNRLGYAGDAFIATRAYNNALRNRLQTDWAFTIFVVDSTPIPFGRDGRFQDASGYAFAYIGGPLVFMSRFSSWAWNAGQYYTAVPAHETGHIFRATDEYDSILGTEGYLYVPDADGTYGLMNQNDLKLSVSTRAQVGLVDCDADSILDLLDTIPAVRIDSAPTSIPEQTATRVTGRALFVPHPNYLPGGRDITVGTISRVEYSLDQNLWGLANATDGGFNEPLEEFYFDLGSLPAGTREVSVMVSTSVGNTGTLTFTIQVQLAGDANGDCTVNFLDLGIVGAAFLKTAGQTGYDPSADLNDDGAVNFLDLGIVGSNFLRVCTL